MRFLELGHFKNGKLKNILVKERFLLTFANQNRRKIPTPNES